MLKTHKRRTSQSIRELAHHSQAASKKHHLKPNNPKSTVYSLVAKSSRAIPSKKTIIEQFQCEYEPEQQTNQNPFFAFGRRNSEPKKWELDMDKITEVQDSNSRRQITSHRSHVDQFSKFSFNEDKENINSMNKLKNKCNRGEDRGLNKRQKNCRASLSNQPKCCKSKKSNSRKPTSNKYQKTKSVIQLSRSRENKDKQQIKLKKNQERASSELNSNISLLYQKKTDKLEKNMKMLWQCMGQLWESSRVVVYKSQKNGQNIGDMRRMIQEQEKKILDLKFEIQKGENTKYGLRF